MKMDLWRLYEMMLRSRLFEESVIDVWNAGKISGEMHMGIGEEAIVAGLVDHLEDGDAMALDHRGTPPMVMRGVDMTLLLKEFMGFKDGLCCGMGGHMHLFSKEHLIASSGILGSSGPAAVGFALASRNMKKNKIAVAFFGEGTMNQGMLMESMNMASACKLPVIFICKDNKMAISTVSNSVTGGDLVERAISFGMSGYEIDGSDVEAVWKIAEKAVSDGRNGKGPSYIHAHCFRREGHFLGDPLLRVSRDPLAEMGKMGGALLKSTFTLKGASIGSRAKSIGTVASILGKTVKEQVLKPEDPLVHVRSKLKHHSQHLEKLESAVKLEVQNIMAACLGCNLSGDN